MLVLSVELIAADDYFVVWTKSGEQISFPVSKKPIVTYNNGCYIVTSNETSMEYPTVEVMKFTLESQTPGGVESLNVDNSNISQQGNSLMLTGFEVGSVIKIFSMNGELILTEIINNDKSHTIDLSAFSKGIYIVSTECITCKIIKR